MIRWPFVKHLALSLVRKDHPAEPLESFNRWIIDVNANIDLRPQESTRDLLEVYAAQVEHLGYWRASSPPIARMIADAIDHNWVRSNVLLPFDPVQLAQSCLTSPTAHALRPARIWPDIHQQLSSISRGNRARGDLFDILASVCSFAQLLRAFYLGSASQYHAAFRYCTGTIEQFLLQRYSELARFARITPAIAMAFFNRSQFPALASRQHHELHSSPISWLFRPDCHVGRLMLYATGRVKASLEFSALGNPFIDAMYSEESSHWPNRRNYTEFSDREDLPRWRCIEDILCWARANNVSGVEIATTLRLIGGGNYGQHRLSTPTSERYRLFCELAHETVSTHNDRRLRVNDPVAPIQ